MGARLVYCSCPDAEVARALARAAVEARLAACATALPGAESTYRWDGAVEQAGEVLLMLKTTASALPGLQALLQSRHPYELPEIIAVEIVAGLPGYLDWVAGETAHPSDDPAKDTNS